MGASLSELARALDHDPFVLIVTEQRCFSASASLNNTSISSNGSSSPVPQPKRIFSCMSSVDDTKNYVDSKAQGDASPIQGGMASVTRENGTSRSPPVKARLVTRSVVSGIVSRIDLLDYISSGQQQDEE
jgi:hypothetical protein